MKRKIEFQKWVELKCRCFKRCLLDKYFRNSRTLGVNTETMIVLKVYFAKITSHRILETKHFCCCYTSKTNEFYRRTFELFEQKTRINDVFNVPFLSVSLSFLISLNKLPSFIKCQSHLSYSKYLCLNITLIDFLQTKKKKTLNIFSVDRSAL